MGAVCVSAKIFRELRPFSPKQQRHHLKVSRKSSEPFPNKCGIDRRVEFFTSNLTQSNPAALEGERKESRLGGKLILIISISRPHGATFISPHLKIIQLSDKRHCPFFFCCAFFASPRLNVVWLSSLYHWRLFFLLPVEKQNSTSENGFFPVNVREREVWWDSSDSSRPSKWNYLNMSKEKSSQFPYSLCFCWPTAVVSSKHGEQKYQIKLDWVQCSTVDNNKTLRAKEESSFLCIRNFTAINSFRSLSPGVYFFSLIKMLMFEWKEFTAERENGV